MVKVKYKVPGMHCPACVMNLEGIEDELPGIHSIRASYHKQEMSVEYDENLVNDVLIQAAAEKKGYILVPYMG